MDAHFICDLIGFRYSVYNKRHKGDQKRNEKGNHAFLYYVRLD